MRILPFRTIAILLAATLLTALPLHAKDKDSGALLFTNAPTCGEFPANTSELVCKCLTGFAQGSVWGSGPYTADSNICMAALHAGVIGFGDSVVQVIHRAGQSSYSGSTRNGVTTSGWGSYHSSFDVYPASGGVIGGGSFGNAPTCGEFPDNTSELVCKCLTGFAQGSVWGSGPYTADSNICTAALHAGVIGFGDSVVQVIHRAGQSSYAGSTRNGVATSRWGSYHSSFDVYPASGSGQSGGGFSSGLPGCGTMPGDTGRFACACPANASVGSVWGSDPYTADSDICTAARHAGIIEASGGGVVVLALQGLDAYSGTLVNNVQTSDWGSYHSSITFDWN